jgi:hypothetical protein
VRSENALISAARHQRQGPEAHCLEQLDWDDIVTLAPFDALLSSG